jgi:putative membrane protein
MTRKADDDDAPLAANEAATPGPAPARTRRYPYVLLALFAVVLGVSAIKPWDVKTWLMENALTAAFVAILVLSRRRLPLSDVSYTLIFVYLCFHVVGSHYSYSRVPVAMRVTEYFGWQRNHYDRFVHFLFGLLLAYPIRELFLRVAGVRGFWGYYLPLDVTMSFSMLYELVEWAAATAFGGELGAAYLGTQGDEWDAHKDMALATLGAVISMAIVAGINWKFDKRFGEEMRDSVRVKGKRPLGEVRLRELINPMTPSNED